MNRRDILKSLSTASAGAALMQAGTAGTSPSAQLYVRDWGKGKPVLFVHGWAFNSDMWQYQMVPLTDSGLRCIAYDRRLHGRSSDPGAGYDADTLAADLASVIDSGRHGHRLSKMAHG